MTLKHAQQCLPGLPMRMRPNRLPCSKCLRISLLLASLTPVSVPYWCFLGSPLLQITCPEILVSESAPKETTLQAYSVELGFEDGGMVPNTHQGDLLNRITEPGLPGEKLALLKLGVFLLHWLWCWFLLVCFVSEVPWVIEKYIDCIA